MAGRGASWVRRSLSAVGMGTALIGGSLMLRESMQRASTSALVHASFSTRGECSMKSSPYDIGVVGGGIVGLATARELQQRHPELRVTLYEKEAELATHQTGHNSGVIHAGMYYAPESLKAKLCVAGNAMMYEYCAEKNIATDRCGKLIVAVDETEVPRLEEIYRRGQANEVVGLSWVDGEGLRAVEPHCRGVAAVHCTSTGVVDYRHVALAMAEDFERAGGEVHCAHKVVGFTSRDGDDRDGGSGDISQSQDYSQGVQIVFENGTAALCNHVIVCAGVYADRLATAAGVVDPPPVVPFRGEYLVLKPEKRHLVRGNIYPVPDPELPFLGVHFTPRVDGSLWLGPNGVLAFSREGYTHGDINVRDLWEVARCLPFWRLAARFFSYGASEFYRSIVLEAQVRQLQRYIPEMTADDVERGPAGVRAQALAPDGSFYHDFIFEVGEGTSAQGRLLHVCNAPSPAATSSLAIAEMVADKAEAEFGI
eukprot:UC1_evm1s1925